MLSKRLFIFFILLLLFFGFQSRNEESSKKAQIVTHLQQEVRQWIFPASTSDAPLLYFTLSEKKLLLTDVSGTTELNLPPHFYQINTSLQGQRFFLSQLFPPGKEQKTAQLVVKVYSDSVTLLSEISYPLLEPESIPQVTLLDNGGLILSESAIGQLNFYAPSGNLTRQIRLFDDAGYDLERVLLVAAGNARSGKVAVLASKKGSAPLDSNVPVPSGEPHLFLFDFQGNKLWQKALPEAAPANLAFSPDGKSLLVSVYSSYLFKDIVKKTLLMQADGAILKSFPFLFKHADFDSQSKLALIADRFTARQINLENGNLLWEYHFLPEKGMITNLKLNESGQTATILTGINRFSNNRFEFHKPQIYIFNGKGKLLEQISFENEFFLHPALTIKNNEIYLGLSHNLYRIEVQR